jgi:hypothetical protein
MVQLGVLQVWLIAGVPALVVGIMLFLARSQLLALLGYVVLAAGFAMVTSVDRASGAVFGALLALMYATGEGTREESHPSGAEVIPDEVEDAGHGHAAA